MRVRNKRNGGVVDVDSALGERLDPALWEPVQTAPAPVPPAKKAAPRKKAHAGR